MLHVNDGQEFWLTSIHIYSMMFKACTGSLTKCRHGQASTEALTVAKKVQRRPSHDDLCANQPAMEVHDWLPVGVHWGYPWCATSYAYSSCHVDRVTSTWSNMDKDGQTTTNLSSRSIVCCMLSHQFSPFSQPGWVGIIPGYARCSMSSSRINRVFSWLGVISSDFSEALVDDTNGSSVESNLKLE